MSLDLNGALFEKFPILAILQARLNKDAILVSREVLPAHDLANEVDFGLEVCPGASLVCHSLHIVHLLLCQITDGLLVASVTTAEELIGLLDVLVLIVLAWYITVLHVCLLREPCYLFY